jgi:hypothetical protein
MIKDYQMDTTVTENMQQHRFELPIADGAFAAAFYRIDNGRVVLTGRKAIPRCPFTICRDSSTRWSRFTKMPSAFCVGE